MPPILKIGFYLTLFLVALFLFKKKKPRPSKLKLEAYKDLKKNKLGAIRRVTAEVVLEDEDGVGEREDIFLFQGKKHSAWAVLKIPVGSDKAEIKRAYAQLLQGEPQKKELFFKAYKTLVG